MSVQPAMGANTLASEDLAVRDQLNVRLIATTNALSKRFTEDEECESRTKKENNDAVVHRLSIPEIDKRHILCPMPTHSAVLRLFDVG